MGASPRNSMSATGPSSMFARSFGKSSRCAVSRSSSAPPFGFWRRPRRLLFLVGVGADVVPEIIDVGVVEHALPRRHLVFAIEDGVFEARPLVGLQLP